MKNLQRLKISTLCTALSVALAGHTTEASSKIYLNGKWHSAKQVSHMNIWDNNALFNNKIPNFTQALARDFLKQNDQHLSLSEKITLNAVSESSSEEFQTVRFKKTLMGLEVLGGEALVNIANNRVELVNADNTNLDAINVIPSLSSKEAESIAFASYQGQALTAGDTKLKVLVSRDDRGENVANLVYEITVRDRDTLSSDVHFIDAQRGNEVLATTNVHTIKARKILAGAGNEADFDLDENSYKLVFADTGCNTPNASPLADWEPLAAKKRKPRAPANINTQPCNNVTPEVAKSADWAFKNSGMVYDYYKTVHNRDSIDGRGIAMRSVVNFGEKFSNAAWISNKNMMIYGMGDGQMFNDFAMALDVAGHEFTHGITSRTAGLQYVSESGALNESYSDIFGKLIDIKYGKGSNDWKIGKEIFKGGKDAIRDMENPEIGHTKDFKYRGEQCSRANDFCGVHSNSGIPNRAAVMVIKQLGQVKAGKLYYLTLTQLLRSTTNFKEARAQTEAACAKLFGASSADCKTVSDSFTAVGI